MALNFYDRGPRQQMSANFTAAYSSGDLRYPSDLGNGNGHSFVQFRAMQQTALQHHKENINPAKGDGSQIGPTINIYMPEGVAVSSSVNYRQDESRIGANILGNDIDLGMAAAVGASLGINVGNAIGQLPDALVGASGLSKQVLTGKGGNAGQYQLLEGINFRTFQYAYKFNPKNSSESNSVSQMIKFFRQEMAPEITQFLQYKLPHTFDICYYVNGRKDTLHKIKPSVLTQCDVSYGSDGEFGIFADGMPSYIEMNLTFSEVLLVDKKAVVEGY